MEETTAALRPGLKSSSCWEEVRLLKKLLVRVVRQSPAMIVAMLALFVALTGTAVATTSALIGSAQIRNNSITGLDVKNRSLRPIDFRGSVRGPRGLRGLTGATGAPGATGATGPPGAPNPNAANSELLDGLDSASFQRSVRWALVDAAGNIEHQSGGISMTSSSSGGYYLNFGEPVTGKLVLALGAYDSGFDTDLTSSPCGDTDFNDGDPTNTQCAVPGTNDVNHLYVQTRLTAGGGSVAKGFYVAVFP